MIESLKGKLRESRIRGGERRSRETKNYIGDGKDYQLSGEDYQGYGLSELD